MDKRLFIPVLLSVLSACFFEKQNARLRSQLDGRAKFDLNCPQVELYPLQGEGLITTYGAMGCGRRATYVLSMPNEIWILNAETSPSGAYYGPYPQQPVPQQPFPQQPYPQQPQPSSPQQPSGSSL